MDIEIEEAESRSNVEKMILALTAVLAVAFVLLAMISDGFVYFAVFFVSFWFVADRITKKKKKLMEDTLVKRSPESVFMSRGGL